MNKKIYDCLVIGAGPAGLLTAVYLARYRRNVAMVEDGHSRALLIPHSHNYPGAANGISGKKILAELTGQVQTYKVNQYKDSIVSLSKEQNIFKAVGDKEIYFAKKIVLATGMITREPNVPALKKAFLKGLIRHCMVCDAYEVINKNIAIIGSGKNALQEACFMLTYTKKVSLFTLGKPYPLKEDDKNYFKKFKIKIYNKPISDIRINNKEVKIFYDNNTRPFVYDALYSALGSIAKSDLVRDLKVKLSEHKCIITNQNQQTSLSGLYAVGDVAVGLKQMVNAFGQAATASTAIHNVLNKEES